MTDIESLYLLQDVDAKLERLRAQLERSDVSERAERAAERRKKARRALAMATSAAEDADKIQKRLELDLGQVEARIESLQSKIYAGEIVNPKELASMQQRLDVDVRTKERLEESLIEAMDKTESGRAQLREVEALAEKIDSEYRTAMATLKEHTAAWEREAEALRTERERIAAAVDSRLLKRYHALYRSTGGRPVAKVIERTCEGCHVGLPTGARRDETTACPQCDRMLWWP